MSSPLLPPHSASEPLRPVAPAEWLSGLPCLLVMLIVTLVYGLAVAAGLLMGRLSLDVGTVWLAAGVGVMAVTIWGYRLLPLIALVHIGVSLAVGTLPFLPRLGMGFVATLEIALAAWWLCRRNGYTMLRFDLAGTARFALVCVLIVPLGGALLVTAYLWLIGTIPAEAAFVVARNWWLSVGLGLMTVVPLATTWLVHGRPRIHALQREAWLALLVLAGPAMLIFGYQLSQLQPVAGVFYASLPLLLWAGIFLRETGATTGLAAMTLLATLTSLWAPGEQMPIWSTGAHVISFGLMSLLVANAQNSLEQMMAMRARQSELERWAYQDSLTDLANRHHLHLGLEEALLGWERDAIPFAVLMMDLDGFKPINDGHGHDVGDEVLRIVAARLRYHRRPGDLMARLGGDEFVVVLHACENLAQARRVGERLLHEITRPMTLPAIERPISLGASIGLSHVQQGAGSIQQLLKQADLALYRAKQAGRGRVASFES